MDMTPVENRRSVGCRCSRDSVTGAWLVRLLGVNVWIVCLHCVCIHIHIKGHSTRTLCTLNLKLWTLSVATGQCQSTFATQNVHTRAHSLTHARVPTHTLHYIHYTYTAFRP